MLRTRFAPSPTGYLHVGGARTALYCWLYAKRNKGHFILRIEDTDRERSTKEAIDAILEAMAWLGLDYDEGPFYQMKRLERYQAAAEQLLQSGHAYRCYCSKERLEHLREELIKNKQKPRYDGHCRHRIDLPKDEPYVIRFKNPEEGEVVIEDCVHGRIVVQNAELDDLVLVRSDGVPTYNFGVVVDDLDMKVTHVIRGDDHVANTPRQINIIRALGGAPPIYAHTPMILGEDGKRLSKRHGAVSVQHYRDEGFLPEALLNYLVRLGWSHGDQEIFTLEEMIQYFDIHDLNKAPAAFNTEKLLWLNQHYLKTRDPNTLVEEFKRQLNRLDIDTTEGPRLADVIVALRERAKTLKEMADKSRYFFEEPYFSEEPKEHQEPLVHLKPGLDPESLPHLAKLRETLEELKSWNKEDINKVVHETAEMLGLKFGKLANPLRIAVTGGNNSPSIDITLELIGKNRVLARLDRIINPNIKA